MPLGLGSRAVHVLESFRKLKKGSLAAFISSAPSGGEQAGIMEDA